MTKTFKTILGLILAWALVAQAGISTSAQTPTLTTLQNAATATGNGTPLNINGPAGNPANTLGAAGIQLIGSGTWVVTFEVTTDGTNWTAAMATNMADDVRDTTASAAGHYTILYGSAVSVRARVSSYTSGSVTAKGRLIPGLVSRVASSGGGGGSGDVVGPASATDNAIARFNLATGKLIQNSVVTIADSTGDMAGVGTVNTHTIPGGTDTFAMLAATQTLSNKTFVAPALGTPVSGVATNLTGTAAGLTAGAATVLATARTINGTSFDGSANITVTAAAGTLTGATLAAGVTASSLTSFGSTPTIITPSFTTGFTIGGVAATGTIPRGNGTNFVASAYTMAAPGTTGNVLTSDGTNWLSSAPAGGGITIGTTTITSGTSGRLGYNNAGVYGETSSFLFTPSANWTLQATPALSTAVGMIVKEDTSTPPVGVGGFPALLQLHTLDDLTFYALAYTSDGTTVEWANFLNSSGQIVFDASTNAPPNNGTVVFSPLNSGGVGTGVFSVTSGGQFSFSSSSGDPFATQDLVMRRLAAASLVQGAANNATPVANIYTIGESSRGGTDSNVAGANGTVQSGLGTGTGALATLILRSPIAAASGTTAQTYATGLTVIGGTAKMTSYTVAALPAAATVGAGARAFVTDALTPVFGSAVTGGGAVGVPVYSDGSTWLVG